MFTKKKKKFFNFSIEFLGHFFIFMKGNFFY
jgi:hypothetical protein